MPRYEQCAQCSGWINTEQSSFDVLQMHDGRELFAHHDYCAWRYVDDHIKDIKAQHQHNLLRRKET